MQVCLPGSCFLTGFSPSVYSGGQSRFYSLNNCELSPWAEGCGCGLEEHWGIKQKTAGGLGERFWLGEGGTFGPGLTSGAGGVFSPPGTLWVASLLLGGPGFPAYLPFPYFAFWSANSQSRASKIYFFLEPTLPFDLGLSLWAKNGAGCWGEVWIIWPLPRTFRPWQSVIKGRKCQTHWKSEWSVGFHFGACSLLFCKPALGGLGLLHLCFFSAVMAAHITRYADSRCGVTHII